MSVVAGGSVSRRPKETILGVDTSIRSSGVGVLVSDGATHHVPLYGVVNNPPKRPHSECLVHLAGRVEELLDEFSPDAVAIEGVFHSKNARTAMVLGQARGAVITVVARRQIPVYEYAPRLVKKAIAGFGGAGKDQMARSVRMLLNLDEEPQNDAADALAIALCHVQQLRVPGMIEPTRL